MITEFGQIPSHWKISSIKEETELVTDYVANGSFASLKENVTYSSIPDYAVIIRLTDFNNQFKGPFVYVSKSAYEFLKKSKLNGGEIIISNVGAYTGTVFRTPKLSIPKTLGPNSIMVNFKGSNDFYEYWFKSKFGQFMIQGIISGSAQPKFNKTSFRSLSIPVPPLEEQKAIAEVLSSLDDKIELLQKQNETLEALAQTLFRQWFIEEAEDSWKEVELHELVDLQGGYAFKSSSYADHGDYTVITIKSVQDGYLDTQSANHIDVLPEKLKPYQLLEHGDVLLSLTGNVGRVCLVDQENCVLNQRVAKIKAKNELYGPWSYFFFRQPCMISQLTALSKGTAQLNLSPVETGKIIVKNPDNRVLEKFNNIVSPMLQKVLLNKHSIHSIIETRDTILPKLMSGQVRVKLD